MQVRLFCDTTRHARKIHIKTSNPNMLKTAYDAVRPADFAVTDFSTGFTALAGHSANLPAAADTNWGANTPVGFTNFLPYTTGSYQWVRRSSSVPF
jgi:hypothetical protein